MKVIIFGCGGVGVKAMHKLMAEGKEIVCFADNSSSKWGTCCEGRRVIPPQYILQEQFDYIAIGIFKAVNIVKKQLEEIGIREEQLIVPIEPDKIFPYRGEVSLSALNSLEEKEYLSRNTKEYQKLNIQITDYQFIEKLNSLKETLIKNNIPRGKVCVVSGAVLQVLGLRESKEFDDIDIIMTDDLREIYGSGLVIVSEVAEMHIQNGYHISDNEIIRNQAYHFVYHDLKFMHPQILLSHLEHSGGEEYDLLKGVKLWSMEDE